MVVVRTMRVLVIMQIIMHGATSHQAIYSQLLFRTAIYTTIAYGKPSGVVECHITWQQQGMHAAQIEPGDAQLAPIAKAGRINFDVMSQVLMLQAGGKSRRVARHRKSTLQQLTLW